MSTATIRAPRRIADARRPASRGCRRVLAALVVLPLLVGCSDDGEGAVASPPLRLRAVTFNTGTNPGQAHDALPDDGYTSVEAAISDTWYGNGLAWRPVIDDVQRFFTVAQPDVVAFQEIFYSGDCPDIPAEFRAGFVCDGWQPGDPTVAQIVVGSGYQVACNLGKPDKCMAVKRSFGKLRDCNEDLCLDGLDGAQVDGCGHGSRIGRGVIDLATGGTLTVVNVHGSSGLSRDDMNCRVAQFAQVFEDLGLGDGQPAANGERNLIMGDLNTDPGRAGPLDASARAFAGYVGEGQRFAFITPVGPQAPPTYAGIFNIDHVVSDTLRGDCWVAGVTDGHPPVTNVVYFDHKPVVCDLETH